jgi:hypothetical protein
LEEDVSDTDVYGFHPHLSVTQAGGSAAFIYEPGDDCGGVTFPGTQQGRMYCPITFTEAKKVTARLYGDFSDADYGMAAYIECNLAGVGDLSLVSDYTTGAQGDCDTAAIDVEEERVVPYGDYLFYVQTATSEVDGQADSTVYFELTFEAASNVIGNPGFEIDLTGWTGAGSGGGTGNISRSTTQHHIGSASLRIEQDNGTGYYYASCPVTVQAGKTYHVYLFVKLISGTEPNVRLEALTTGFSSNLSIPIGLTPLSPNAWEAYVDYSWTPGTTGTGEFRLEVETTSPSAVVFFDDISILEQP